MRQESFRNRKLPTGADVVDDAARKAEAILQREFRGMTDTIEGSMYRAEARWGIPFATFFSLRYRRAQLGDVKGSIVARINAAYGYVLAQQREKLREDLERTRKVIGEDAANSSSAVRAATAALVGSSEGNPPG